MELLDFKLDDLLKEEASVVTSIMINSDKKSLLEFSKNNSLPCRQYESRLKIAESLASQVNNIGIFKRISRS